MNRTQAAAFRLARCPTCGLLGAPSAGRLCRRCGNALHLRKPDSLQRTWALLIAAYVCRGALNFDQSCAMNNDQGT